ncbi:MAG: ADP-glyceromanno-heptose 6-epimerase [Candidatus Omnitrophota bacterium]
MKTQTVVLTGGAGFIGSCFLWKLNKEGIDNIVVVDNLGTSEKWRNLTGKRFSDYIQKDDFLKVLSADKIRNVSAVVHLGACSSTTLTDAAYYIRNNYEYSKTIAVWARRHGARFIYASSAATYGSGAEGYDDSEATLYNLKPLNMYGYSKHLFDMWALNNGMLKETAGIKFFNVFGPNEYHKGEMMSVICKRFKDVRDKGVIRLFKSYNSDYRDGEQQRDFIYVKDAVKVLYHFFTHPRLNGIFNLGSGTARSWNDLAHAMFSALEKKPRIEYVEMPEEIKPKYQYFTEARMNKLRKAGYRAGFTSLEEAVKDYAIYLKDGSCM